MSKRANPYLDSTRPPRAAPPPAPLVGSDTAGRLERLELNVAGLQGALASAHAELETLRGQVVALQAAERDARALLATWRAKLEKIPLVKAMFR